MYTHTDTRTHIHSHRQTSIYELCKLLLPFLLQCVTASVGNKRVSVFYWSKVKFYSSVWPSGHAVLFPSLPSSFPLNLSPFCCHVNILALSKEVQREEQKELHAITGVSATSHKWVNPSSVFLVLTAHALLAASSFTLTLSSVHHGLFNTILCNAKQDHTTRVVSAVTVAL